MFDHDGRRERYGVRKVAVALTLSTMFAAPMGGCTAAPKTPMNQPREVMTDVSGPFARQCINTRISHLEVLARSGARQVVTSREDCTGFAAMPLAGGAVEITGSTNAHGQASAATVYRILRGAGGLARPAVSGDTGLLAQGSDNPRLADTFARQIGLTKQQIIDPGGRCFCRFGYMFLRQWKVTCNAVRMA